MQQAKLGKHRMEGRKELSGFISVQNRCGRSVFSFLKSMWILLPSFIIFPWHDPSNQTKFSILNRRLFMIRIIMNKTLEISFWPRQSPQNTKWLRWNLVKTSIARNIMVSFSRIDFYLPLSYWTTFELWS